jgi:hypothetical protein
MPQVMVIPFDNQEISQGFNSQTRENLGTALMFTDTNEDPVAPGQDVTTSFEIVSDQESLIHSLGVSATVGARYMLFSADAKLGFAEDHAVNSYSSYIVGRCLVMNALRRGHGFKLTTDADTVLQRPDGMEEFNTAFGDMFVRSLRTGGEFLVVARITSISEEHQVKLTASLHGEYNGLAVGVDFNTAFTNAMRETRNHTDVTVWMRQRGGLEADFTFTGLDASKILTHLADFPTSAHQNPVAYETELATYNTIPIPIPSREEREDQALVLADCAQQKIGFLGALSDLALASSDNASMLFDDLPSRDELNHIKGKYRTALNALMSHAILVTTGHMDPPQLFVANPAPPAITFKKKPFASPPPPVPPPQIIQVPDVTSMSVAEAVQTLTQSGLETQIQKEDVSFLWYKLNTVHLLGAPDSTAKIIGTVPNAGAVENPGTIIIIRVPDHVVGHPDIVLH